MVRLTTKAHHPLRCPFHCKSPRRRKKPRLRAAIRAGAVALLAGAPVQRLSLRAAPSSGTSRAVRAWPRWAAAESEPEREDSPVPWRRWSLRRSVGHDAGDARLEASLAVVLSQEMYTGLYMGLSDDSFSVVIKGKVLEYRENTLYLMSIDLSCNCLTGEIPEELTSLVGLINLNLSSNFFSGNIPNKIGNLRSLESLDLSTNRLGGEIPWDLSNLTYLSYLNLSYNNLSGRIPSGPQLDTLKADDPASIYIGNPDLCGHPVLRQCPGTPGDPPTNEDSARWHEDGLSQLDFLLGSIVGFVAGTWMVFCGLLFMKRWRYAYFRLLDEIYDRLYTSFSLLLGGNGSGAQA